MDKIEECSWPHEVLEMATKINHFMSAFGDQGGPEVARDRLEEALGKLDMEVELRL